MDKKEFTKAIEDLKSNSTKRNFEQSVELILNFKDIDLKKPEQQLNYFAQLTHSTGKKKKICALSGPELEEEATKVCDNTILQKDFGKYMKDVKLSKKIANEYDFFIAQANIMADIAKAFGRTLGVRSKMPNPKSGCVVPPKAKLEALYKKLQTTVHVNVRKAPYFQVLIGTEKMKTEDIADNAVVLVDSVLHHLPNEKNNLRSIHVKLTMSKPVKVF